MDKNIMETIQQKLDEIEKTENVKIIHCIESGSRAWGFASPDSDYDVRFIYVHKPEHYLRLDSLRDVIEWQLDDTLDINGWDLQKALRLLYRSNPTLFEWNNSPIVYRTTEQWDRVREVINHYFRSKSELYHYLSMAKSNYREYLKGETVRLKKYFYVLRPILACKWILDKNSPPPTLFTELVEAELEENLRPIVYGLLERKMNTPELGTGKRIDELNEYIDIQLNKLSGEIAGKDDEKRSDWEELNLLFKEIINYN